MEKNNKNKLKILCFGDSNVYGFMPLTGLRYLRRTRWTGVLQELGKDKYEIIEAGANNRTAFSDNPAGENLTGNKALPKLLNTDIDMVILAVGANDLQYQYKNSLENFRQGMSNLIDIVQKKAPNSRIILASPSVITTKVLKSFFVAMFDETSIEKSHKLAEIYHSVAIEKNCEFIDLNKIAEVSEKDGLHYDGDTHRKIAEAFYSFLNP